MRYTLTPIYFLLELIILVGTVTNGNCYGRYSRPRGSKNRSRLRLYAVFSHPHSSPSQTCGLLFKVGWNIAYLERYAKV